VCARARIERELYLLDRLNNIMVCVMSSNRFKLTQAIFYTLQSVHMHLNAKLPLHSTLLCT